jgi:hypothetical protein
LIHINGLSNAFCFLANTPATDNHRELESNQPASGGPFKPNQKSGVVQSMIIAGVHEVIAGIALIVAGLFVGYNGRSSMIWGALMIVLGILLLIFWSAGTP